MNDILRNINEVLPQDEQDYRLKIYKMECDDMDQEKYLLSLYIGEKPRLDLEVMCRGPIEDLIEFLSYDLDSDKIILME